MKKIVSRLLLIVFCSITSIVISACGNSNINHKNNGKYKVVTTTTMLADMAKIIGGDYIEVQGLMGAGIDPHLYKASAGDVKLMNNADMVVYNGLHLEGKMGEIFENLTGSGKLVVAVSNGLDKKMLIKAQGSENAYDPHIWFDVNLWKDAAKELTEGLKKLDKEHAQEFDKNLKKYLIELDNLNQYTIENLSKIPKESRVLVTAHDAFNYFGKAYDIEVKGLQGISTASEAGTADVRELANFIVDRKIKAIFIESSVPKKNIEALKEAVKAKGFDVQIGGSLYSDSLGDKGTAAEDYIGTFKANVDTIVKALK